jgi:hypothetical protein
MVMKLLLEFHSKTLKYRVLQAIEGAEGPVEKVQYQLKLGFVLQQCLQLVRFGNYGPARLLLHENKHERTRKMLVCLEYLEMRWACQAIEKLKGNTISDSLLRELGAEQDLLMRSAQTPEVSAATWFGSPYHFWTVRIRLERAVFGFQNRSLGTGQAVLDLHIFLETTIDLLSLHVLNIDHGLTYEQKTQAIEQRFVDTFQGAPVAQFLNKRSIPQTIVALLGVCNQPELHAFLTACMQLHNAFSRNTGEQTEVCPPFATPLGMIVPKAPKIPLNEWRNKVAHEGKPYQRRDTQLAEDWAMQIAPHFWSERDHFYLRVNRALERSWA